MTDSPSPRDSARLRGLRGLEFPDSKRPFSKHLALVRRVRRNWRQPIGLKRKGQWVWRGLRWRLISVVRKGQWVWRRLRDRGIGWARRRHMWCVRLTVRAILLIRQVTSSIRRGDGCRNVWNLIWTLFRRRTQQPRKHDDLVLTQRSAAGAEKTDRRLKRQVRRSVLRPLPPSRDAKLLVADLAVPTKWRAKTRRDIGAARCARVSSDANPKGHDSVLALLPVLLSGRPIIDLDVAGFGDVTIDAVRTLDEVERMHLANKQLRGLLTSSGLGNRPRIAVILSTNRPALLPQALTYLRSQTMVDIELRLGLHGVQKPSDLGELIGGAIVDAVLTNYDGKMPFGEVLQHLTTQVETEFFSKWDDDDHYGPSHLIDLWIVAKLTGRRLVGKAAEFVHLSDRQIVVRRRGGPIHTDSRFLAGGALLIARDAFNEVGGWAYIQRGVDQDLISRFASHGYPSFRAHGLDFVLTRHSNGHTWSVDDEYFLNGATEAWGNEGLVHAGVIISQHQQRSDCNMSKNTVSLCVPNRGNYASLRRLESSWADGSPFQQVIVADDRSDPPLRLEVGSGQLQVTRVPDADGFGAGRARNHAAINSKSDVIVFADSDIHISMAAASSVVGLHAGFPTVVHALLEFSSIDSETGLALLERHGSRAFEERLSQASIPGQLWRETHWAQSADLAHPRSSSFRACVGGFISVDRAVYEQTGGFRDVVVRGVEDVEFGYRLMVTGCRQLVYRGSGITHLGQRTFANSLNSREAAARDQALARWVPIWCRNLPERAENLLGDNGNPVPLIGIPDSVDVCQIANEVYGCGTAIDVSAEWSVLNAPFGIADRPLPERAIGALGDVLSAFRNGPCGEVVLISEGDVLARITALWALNRHRVLSGATPILDQRALEEAWSELDGARVATANTVGTAFVSISSSS